MEKEKRRVNVRIIRNDDEKLDRVGFASSLIALGGMFVATLALVTGFGADWARVNTKRTKIVGEKDDLKLLFDDPDDGIVLRPKGTPYPEEEP